MKIKTKIFLIMALLAVLLLGQILLVVNYWLIPMQRNDVIERAWNNAYILQKISPMLGTEELQILLTEKVKNDPKMSYMVILDSDGKAVVHSDPERKGLVFNDPGTLSSSRDGMSLQQEYTRDESQPGSPYYGEKTIDILIPNYDSNGNHIGAINIGVSLDYLSQIVRNQYLVFIVLAVVILLVIYIATMRLYRDIVAPLDKTIKAIRSFKDGNYYDVSVDERDDELGLLASEFNNMTARISELMGNLTEAQCQLETRVEQRTTELAAEKERLAITLSGIVEGVINTNLNGDIILCNQAAAKILGVEIVKLPGKNLKEYLSGISYGKADEETNRNAVVEICNHSLATEEGDERLLDVIGTPISSPSGETVGMVWVLRDISEKQRYEEGLIKASRMESLEIIASGLAHDFNNLLTVIAGNTSLARMASNDDNSSGYFEEVEKATLQARALAQQLLAFSRGGKRTNKAVSVSNLLHNSVNFALSGSNITCEFVIPENLSSVYVDESQVCQVLNNLVINAIQAMPNGGTIRISAKDIIINKPVKDIPLNPGKYVLLAITDQGIGIPEKYGPNIFKPYFTTKENGTGLGLATSYSIIHNHGGYLTYESKPGVGTTFYIYLAAIESEQENRGISVSMPMKGKGHILVADKDETVRMVVVDMLRSLGYEGTGVTDGNQLIELYQQKLKQGSRINAVIIDLAAPEGKEARELVRSLIAIDPEVKVIAISGYAAEELELNYREIGFSVFMIKPFGIEDLSKVMHDLLS